MTLIQALTLIAMHVVIVTLAATFAALFAANRNGLPARSYAGLVLVMFGFGLITSTLGIWALLSTAAVGLLCYIFFGSNATEKEEPLFNKKTTTYMFAYIASYVVISLLTNAPTPPSGALLPFIPFFN